MNLFYAPPGQVKDGGERLELVDKEARHAVRVLRYREGDDITVVDGNGGWYEGTVQRILKNSVQVKIERCLEKPRPVPEIVLGMGIIKKRERLEFAVEKAAELGAACIALFRSDHTVKQNVRLDRLESTVLSAMKQSLRTHLPEICVYGSLEETLQGYPDHQLLAAHEKTEESPGVPGSLRISDRLLLLVGPEGGFSDDEIAVLQEQGAETISLGSHRLRAETAAVVFLSQFI